MDDGDDYILFVARQCQALSSSVWRMLWLFFGYRTAISIQPETVAQQQPNEEKEEKKKDADDDKYKTWHKPKRVEHVK